MFICHKGHEREDSKQRCKICKATNSKKWRNNNKEKIKEIERIYLSNPENRQRKTERDKTYRQPFWYSKYNTSPASRSRTARRRARKLTATPLWANKDLIDTFYIKAKLMEWFTGNKYHVDHIIPLQGEDVCGLHVENNLQILPALENKIKSNKLEI